MVEQPIVQCSAQTLLAKCLLNKLVYLHFGTVGAELSGSFIVSGVYSVIMSLLVTHFGF